MLIAVREKFNAARDFPNPSPHLSLPEVTASSRATVAGNGRRKNQVRGGGQGTKTRQYRYLIPYDWSFPGQKCAQAGMTEDFWVGE
jgi:hypothetical protein